MAFALRVSALLRHRNRPATLHPHADAFQVVVRASGDPAELAPTVRSIFREVDPASTVDTVTLSSRLAASVAQPRFAAATVAAFALLALALAALGL